MILAIIAITLLRVAAAPALQGASSELGQDVYGWVMNINELADKIISLSWLMDWL